MAKGHDTKWRRTLRVGSGLLAGTACLLALPSALAAVSGDSVSLRDVISMRDISVSASGGLGAFTPASINPKLMASLRRASDARGEVSSSLFRFTPAGAAKQGSRSVTVAVRVDPETARAISVRKVSAEAGRGVAAVDSLVFNLGVARGYQSFSQAPALAPQAITRSLTLPSEIGNVAAPDLRSFTPAKSASGKGRFSPTVELEAENAPGTTPRTFGGAGEMSVDVGGAYRVADNLRVTAGIRYSSERDRLAPVTDGQQDSQAVYVGTRFRF
ncbi:hypothetical protein EKN06_06565 [Croceicoccus ponticola]|uniref:Porin n=1 Tax=Croceicoccus ponticola TaxID=2217664 RepID=A0A437GYX5_9SPHN|nr:hypothetical protein [Croceicoccus ponticola]RVQ67856.1 hypothetical protein EKN06_06565 [Croceicoccus ponticola]